MLALCSAGARAEEAAPDSLLKQIRARGELKVGLEAGYMPFEMRDKRGGIIGFDVDMAKLMARKLGVKLTLVNTQWDGIIPALLTSKFDVLMSGMTITEERAKQVDFSDPYIVIGQSILIQPKLAATVKSVADLNDPKYIVVTKLGTTGDVAASEFLPHATIQKFETEAEAILQVRGGRASAFVYDLPYNAVYAARNPGQLVLLPKPFTREELGWAIRKGDPEWRAWLNEFLAGAHADKAYDALYGKWFERTAWLRLVN
ncbi:transporter substrate-binding domain-containing protein [Hydrocarboniphaga sp.]|uniref:transporter substrate-binding domain-containing protein n=1 Tax=Hydrocarboniphaga sp. TaxID=2033016 RepID=UPI003D0E63ED